MSNRPYTSRAKHALALADGAAAGRGDEFIGTEHLLLGLLAERTGPAAQMLQHLGVTTAKVDELVTRSRAPAGAAAPRAGTCALRPLVPADAPSLARHANDRDVWLGLRDRFPHPYTERDAEAYIAHVATQEPRTSFGIVVDDAAIGTVSLVPGHDIERLSAEIGYWIGREFWGRGIATQAVRRATEHAIATLGMRRVFAVPFVRNAPSHRVLEKAGYVREGHMRRSAIKDGELLDQYLYAAYDDRRARPPA